MWATGLPTGSHSKKFYPEVYRFRKLSYFLHLHHAAVQDFLFRHLLPVNIFNCHAFNHEVNIRKLSSPPLRMTASKKTKHKKSRLPLVLSILLFAAIIGSYFIFPQVREFLSEAWNTLTSEDEEKISAWVSDLGFWGPLFVIITMSLQMFLLVIPSPLLIIISVLAYGPVIGSVLSVAAVGVASTLGYFIGKYLGEAFISRLIGEKKEKKMTDVVNRYGYWAVFITRLTPVLSNDAISFASGVLRMGYWKFLGATLAGITPLTILIAYFGETNDRLKWGLFWVSLISLIVLAAYIIYDRKKRAKHATRESRD